LINDISEHGDIHVMIESLDTIKKYTGERYFVRERV